MCWVVGLKVSSAAGGQPLPTQPGGPGSYLVVAGESWPLKDPWDKSHPQGRQQQAVPCSLVGLPGSEPRAPSPLQARHTWHHTAVTASFARWQGPRHGDQLAAGPFTPVPLSVLGGGVPCLGGQPCPGGWHSHMEQCPPPWWLGASAIPPVCKNGTGWFCSQPECWHMGSCPQPGDAQLAAGLFPSGGDCLAWGEGWPS